MKEKVNFKGFLTAISLLTVTTSLPTSTLLNVVNDNFKLNSNFDLDMINEINNLTDLTIDISANEMKETVFHILNHDTLGIAERLAKHHDIAKEFQKDLFKLHTEKVFFDENGEEKISKDTIVETRTYYFQFSYNNQKSDAFVPIKISNTEQEIVSAINYTSYQLSVWIGTTVKDFKRIIDDGFIKSQLHDRLQSKYRNFFTLNEVTINGQPITDADLTNDQEMDGIVNYSYGSFTNQNTNLKISKTPIKEIDPKRFVEIAKERSTSSPLTFTIKTFTGSGDYVPDVLKMMGERLIEEFLNIYKVRVNLNKLKLEKITSILMNPKTIDTQWFIKKLRFNATVVCSYDGLSTGSILIRFNVVDNID